MYKGHYSMKFDRKPPIGRGDKYPFASDTPRLSKESSLLLSAANMLQDRARVDVVKFLVKKREAPAVGKHKPHSGIHFLKKPCVIYAARSNTIFVWIPAFEIIGMAVCQVTCNSDIEDRVLRLDTGRGEENIKHLPSLVGGYLDRDRVWSSNVVLGVYVHSVYLAIRSSVAVARECSERSCYI